MAIYLTPGPSHPYPKLRSFLDDAWNEDVVSWSHRSTAFSETYERAKSALCELMDIPEGFQILFVGSATEAMERTIQGLVRKKSHHIVLGAFGKKWQQISSQLGKTTSITELSHDNQLSGPVEAELVCATLNETSIGSMLPAKALETLRHRPKDQLLALDIVSAAPLIPVDWSLVDVAFFSVQKAFGLPSGLGVIIINQKALEQAKAIQKDGFITGSYHSLIELAKAAEKYQTPETPNVLGIYLLARVAEDMVSTGAKSLRSSTSARAQKLYEALDKNPKLSAFVGSKEWRSPTVIVADVKESNDTLLKHLVQNGYKAGTGYAPEHKTQHIRIANFPAISNEDFYKLIDHIENW